MLARFGHGARDLRPAELLQTAVAKLSDRAGHVDASIVGAPVIRLDLVGELLLEGVLHRERVRGRGAPGALGKRRTRGLHRYLGPLAHGELGGLAVALGAPDPGAPVARRDAKIEPCAIVHPAMALGVSLQGLNIGLGQRHSATSPATPDGALTGN